MFPICFSCQVGFTVSLSSSVWGTQMKVPPACQCCLSRPREQNISFICECIPGSPAYCPQLFLFHDKHDQKYRTQAKQKPTKPCHTALWKELVWTEESGDAASLLLFYREASVLTWTAELGIASVIIIGSGRVELFLKELPAGQRVAPKRKNNQICPLCI